MIPKPMLTPPTGAGCAKVTVPVEPLPPNTEVGFRVRLDIAYELNTGVGHTINPP